MPRSDTGGRLLASTLFSQLEKAAAEDILARSEEVRFRRRRMLFRQGDPVSGLYLIVSGAVKLTQVGSGGQEVIMRVAGPGDIVAALAAFATARHFPVTATALTDGASRFWERPAAHELVRSHPALSAALTGEIGRQTQTLQHRLCGMASSTVAERLAATLVRLTEQFGVDHGETIEIAVPLTRLELAQMSGTTLYTVSRLLSQWGHDGIVATGRSRVDVRSLARLRLVAGDPD